MKFPPKKILVPFDFSEVSVAAWKHAKAIAEKFGAEIWVLYVEELMPPSAWPYQIQRFDLRMKKEITSHIHDLIGADNIHVSQGDPVVTILRTVRTRKPDLVVMGTHGRTGFDRLWMGSVAEAVVRLSPIPVLTAHSTPEPIKDILAPVNLTNYSEYGFVCAAGIASAYNACLTVLNVSSDPLDLTGTRVNLQSLVDHLPAQVQERCKTQVEVKKGDPTAGILSAAKDSQLLVLVAHRKSLLKDIVLGMTVERVLRLSPVPVLSIPAPKSFYRWNSWPTTLAMVGAEK